MNKTAIRKLARLERQYENGRTIPPLNDVETVLWRAGEAADRRLVGFWPWGPTPLIPSDIEHWTSRNLGWSFPCAEAVELIRRLIRWPCGRVIEIGAGQGLWTRVLKRAFGSDRVVGLDPESTNEDVLEATFDDWCDRTDGPEDADLLFASWLPCEAQEGSDLGHRILDRVVTVDQTFVYVGSGPGGPVATKDFYDRLGVEFDEYATEPLPRVHPSVFPRDFKGLSEKAVTPLPPHRRALWQRTAGRAGSPRRTASLSSAPIVAKRKRGR